VDIDDDNDGILDAVECVPNSGIQYFFYGNNSGTSTFPPLSFNSTYLASADACTVGSGIGATRNVADNFLSLTGVGLAGTTLASAEIDNDFLQYRITTSSDTYNWINQVQVYMSSGIAASYTFAVVVSTDNYATRTVLNPGILYTNGTGTVTFPVTPFEMSANTT
jgi:hypothetical protein